MFVEKIHFTAQRSIVSIKSIHKMHKATLLSIIGLLAFSCSVKVKQLFSLKVSDNTFYDDDGNNTLSYSATSADGSALPVWLTFDVKRKILSGIPQRPGSYLIKITATDNAGATAVCTFTLTVE